MLILQKGKQLLKQWALSALAAIAKSSQVPVKSFLWPILNFLIFYVNYCIFAGQVSRVLQYSYALHKFCDDESKRGI